jgi:type II secretory pathway predicted ATPase ExeA
MNAELLFFPCITNVHGRIVKKVSNEPMTKDQAENYLKTNFKMAWFKCEAIPQLITTKGLE